MDIIRQEGEYRIERNANGGSYFLVHQSSAGRLPTAVGGIYTEPNHAEDGWSVDVNVPYDPETNSDITLLGERMDEQAALELLWANRYNAYLG